MMSRGGRQGSRMEIRVDGVLLRQVHVFKYLGFLVTPTLSPAAHVIRATERARAAAATIVPILKRLSVTNFARLRTYLTCYVESQFYGIELLPPTAVDAMASARSMFVRSVFDLPQSTNHELATILFDSPPLDLLFLRRLRDFLQSVNRHDFSFVRNASQIDRSLSNLPVSLHACLHRSVRRFMPNFSSATDNLYVAVENILLRAGHPSFTFQFISTSDSQSLSFFVLFESEDVLRSFRVFLQNLGCRVRLVLLFCTSLLRFRFCKLPRELCPLCGRVWMWEHFFTCRYLEVAPGLDSNTQVLTIVQGHVRRGEWEIFLQYVRFYLLEWHDLVRDPMFSDSDINALCDD